MKPGHNEKAKRYEALGYVVNADPENADRSIVYGWDGKKYGELVGDDARFVSVESEAAATLGRRGGSAKTPAKAEAARENGKRGGRPRRYYAVDSIGINADTNRPHSARWMRFDSAALRDMWVGHGVPYCSTRRTITAGDADLRHAIRHAEVGWMPCDEMDDAAELV